MTGVRVTIHDQLGGPGASPTYQLAEHLTITPADVGTTFTINAASDPDFATWVQTITNGSDNGFGYNIDNLPMAGGQGVAWTEANLFAAGTRAFGPGSFTSIGQLTGPDFAGYEVVALTLRIDSFDLSSGWGGNNHNFRATATIVAVPEPGTFACLATGAALLCGSVVMRRRRASLHS